MTETISDGAHADEVRIVYASWPRRIASGVIDFWGLAVVVPILDDHGERALAIAALVLAYLWWLFNALLAGLNGQSFGKRAVGTVLVDGDAYSPIGARRALLRVLAHVVDSLPMGIGWIAPLFSRERRCFADIIMNTVVVMKQSTATVANSD
ncbi:MAG TPA: RDD family protein [Mycobacteriales bacterium]|nr:RDD family protein [Mycobacteriales bacterium]